MILIIFIIIINIFERSGLGKVVSIYHYVCNAVLIRWFILDCHKQILLEFWIYI